MKKQNLMLGVCVLAAALFCGCRSTNKNATNLQIIHPKAVVINTGAEQGSLPIDPQFNVTGGDEVNGESLTVLAEHHDKLRLFISGEGATASERLLADRLTFQTTSGVASDVAEVLNKQSISDIVLRIRPHLVTVDHDGNYWRMNCEISAELRGNNMIRTFASKTFKFEAPQRVLGLEKAESQFDAAGGKAVAEWTAAELRKVFEEEIGVSQLAISLPGKSRNTVDDSRYIQDIGAKLQKLNGLVSYELTGKDSQKGLCVFRLVYFRSSFPTGISTHVSAVLNAPAKNK
ncbi:MAG: hypothetical protein J6X49_09805 [Victivallales bacterium]|nr:hypothetical protein [Victivallales bacterium]